MVRAGLVTAVADAVDGWLLDPRIAYVTAPKLVPTPLASAYEVVEELPYKEKALRAWVRAQGIGTLEIKKRGVDVDPAVLRKKLAPKGSATRHTHHHPDRPRRGGLLLPSSLLTCVREYSNI